MKPRRGSRVARRDDGAGEAGARARLEALFARIDRLTPDELARFGLRRDDDDERAELRRTVAAAARASGRSALVSEARASVREAVLARYSAGSLHQTWIEINWGLSQGTTADRVAIVDALQDAAAAVIVADLVDPEVTEALTLDAGRVTGLALGDACEGSFDRALRPQPGGSRKVRWMAITLLALLLTSWGLLIGAALYGLAGGVVGLAIALAIAWTVTRVRADATGPAD